MNFTVHTVMYSYFALKAIGINVPSRIALVITIMQISQMFLGLFFNFVSHRLYLAGKECGVSNNLFILEWPFMEAMHYSSYISFMIVRKIRRNKYLKLFRLKSKLRHCFVFVHFLLLHLNNQKSP